MAITKPKSQLIEELTTAETRAEVTRAIKDAEEWLGEYPADYDVAVAMERLEMLDDALKKPKAAEPSRVGSK